VTSTAAELSKAGFGHLLGWQTEVEHRLGNGFVQRADLVMRASAAGVPALLLEIDRRTEDAHELVHKLQRYADWFRLLAPDHAGGPARPWRGRSGVAAPRTRAAADLTEALDNPDGDVLFHRQAERARRRGAAARRRTRGPPPAVHRLERDLEHRRDVLAVPALHQRGHRP
jgi:hypothetical protein